LRESINNMEENLFNNCLITVAWVCKNLTLINS